MEPMGLSPSNLGVSDCAQVPIDPSLVPARDAVCVGLHIQPSAWFEYCGSGAEGGIQLSQFESLHTCQIQIRTLAGML
jgi:hypothetical protein